MKQKAAVSFLISLSITIFIFFFSNIYFKKNYSSTIHFKISETPFINFSMIKIPAIGIENYNSFMANDIINYLSEIFYSNKKKNSKLEQSILINKNENCKITRKFNKIPISFTTTNFKNDYRGYLIEINYIINDNKNVKICNQEFLKLMNNRINDNISFHLNYLKEAISFQNLNYKKNKNFLENYVLLENSKQLTIEDITYLLYANYSKLEQIYNSSSGKQYYEIADEQVTLNEVTPKEIFIYLIFIFLFLFIFLYFTFDNFTIKYYKKIRNYIK